ncbi:MAG: glycosyltransferase [Candidatus Avigastranaerophilus sp.]
MLEYNICYSLDSKYVEQLAVSMCSILKNADDNDNITFYILDGGLTQKEKSGIEKLKEIKDFSVRYININPEEFANCPLNVIKKGDKYEPTHVTLPAYFRIKLPSLLKELDKILYLDCDVVVRTSLKELFEQDVTDKAVLMTLDAESEKEAERLGIKRYFNSGVLFINLDYWRKNDVENKLLGYINENQRKILWFDQDVINDVLEGQIGEISNKWNYQYFQYEEIDINEFANSSIIHMAGRFKPWLMSFEHPVYDLYYYYLSFTRWNKNVTLYKNMSFGRHLKNGIGGSVTNITVDATDEDIQKVYSEIDNNYKLIDTTRDFLESKIDFVQGLNDELKHILTVTTDDKISRVYEEITKNYEYTNSLVEDAKSFQQDKFNNEIIRLDNEINSCRLEFDNKIIYESAQTDDKISKVYDEVSKNYKYTEKLVQETKEEAEKSFKVLTQKENDIKTELADCYKNFDNRFKELYSYINEEVSNIYKTINENYKLIENKIINKDIENLSRIENLIAEINKTNEKLSALPKMTDISSLEEKILQIKLQNKINLEELQKRFEDELNQQRIKYENRLMETEKIIRSLDDKYQPKKRGILTRIKNKIKKVIHK